MALRRSPTAAQTQAVILTRFAISSPGPTRSASLTASNFKSSFGAWFERLQANDSLEQDQYGQASFNNLQTFLTGSISTYTFAPAYTPLSWRSLEGAVYAEDAIKLAIRN